jgi:hypothetical protein
VNHAVVNEDPNEAMIRDLRDEVEKSVAAPASNAHNGHAAALT